MKKMIFIIALVFNNSITGQIDTNIVYPMQIGNYWEYWDYVGSGAKLAETIVKDTLMPNGKKYFLYRECYFYLNWYCNEYTYLRIDSNRYVYKYGYENPECINGEALLYDFNAPDSTFWFRCNFLPGLYWGLSRSGYYSLPFEPYIFRTKTFTEVKIDSTVVPPRIYWDIIGRTKIAKGIGKVDSQADQSPWYVLVGTILNGIKYGIITSLPNSKIDHTADKKIFIQAHPNPFNGSTKVIVENLNNKHVDIEVFNVLGELLFTIDTEKLLENTQEFSIDLFDYPSGIYFLFLKTNDQVISIPLIQIK